MYGGEDVRGDGNAEFACLGRVASSSALPHTAARRENKAAGGAGGAGGERRWGRERQ